MHIINNMDALRREFPILSIRVNNKPLVYFDNAATTQKPLRVIDKISSYYKEYNANVHRGNHHLSILATEKLEESRTFISSYINAAHSHEIIFTRGTTESINLVASVFGFAKLKKGDAVLITEMEHHSNIVPWQMNCERYGANLKVAPINEKGELLIDRLEELMTEDVKIIALTHISNTLGTINPVKDIISMAHQKQIPVLVDGAQAVPHLRIDVQDLDCDFYCFSGHKAYGPTGIGVLYAKEKWLNELPPYQGGGEMIESVTFEKTTFNVAPFKFEAGTPNIEGGIVIAEALKFIRDIGIEKIAAHEKQLLDYATEKLSSIDGTRIIGTATEKASVISFLVEGTHPGDLGILLDKMGVAVRVGNHCTEPLMRKFNIPGTVRASFALYNTCEEIDVFIVSLKKALEMLK